MTSSSGPRAASETSIVRFAPSRAMSEPAGMPKIAIGSISAARTQPIFAVEPVVDEDEPRQGDEGHRRAGEGDELGGDEAERASGFSAWPRK